MANAYTPEEIAELKAREADEIKRLGQATIETRMALLDMAAGTKGLTASLVKTFGSLGTSAVGLTKQLYNGETGASVFNKSINATADALGDLVGLIPYVGGVLKTFVKGAADYTQAVNEQADLLYKNYQEMSKIGATAAEGMTGVYDNLKRMNYDAKNEIGLFVGLVRENSQTLASFGKTVGSGLTEIAGVSKAIQDGDIGRQFLDMGMSVDDINRGILSFTKMQMLTGGRQKMTTDELISASQNYIKEVDLLAKITGKDRASQEKARESAMAEERYAALAYELKQRADMGDKAAEAQLTTNDRIQQQMEQIAPGMRKGFLNILSGTMNTPESKQLALAMPRAAAIAQKKFFTQAEFEEAAREDLTRSLKGTGDQIVGAGTKLAQIGAQSPTFGDFQEKVKYLGMLEQGSFEEREAAAKKAQTVTDKATQNIVDINIQNRKTRDTLQDLVNVGIVPVTDAMVKAAGATNATVEAFEKMATKMGVTVKKRETPGAAEQAPPRPAAPRPVAEGARVSGTPEAKASAEKYLGKAISDAEFSALIKATHAEAAGGKQASQQEQAMIMASVLNRARTDKGGIMGALTAKNQFQSVTGTANEPGPSRQYLQGPEKERLKSIEGATQLLENISRQQKNFTAADAKAYGPGTNIGYRDKMLANGGTVVGGSVFETTPAQAPISAPKPAAPVPVEVKPVEVKPVEVKPVEVKPVEVKPVEVKPVEVKAPEVPKPVEVKPVVRHPVDKTTGKELHKALPEPPLSSNAKAIPQTPAPVKPKTDEKKTVEIPKPAPVKPKTDEKKTVEIPKPALAPADPKPVRTPLPFTNTTSAVEIDPKTLLPKSPPVAPPVAPTPRANGGVIPAVPGGVNVLAAEAGKNEAFVPLPDGKTIPVTIASNVEQMGMMAAQLDRLDSMIQLMKNQLGVSEKILKYAQ